VPPLVIIIFTLWLNCDLLLISSVSILISCFIIWKYNYVPCKTSEECDKVIDKDTCINAGYICMTDTEKNTDECGECSTSNLLENECEDNDSIWTSNMSSCYWVTPEPSDINNPPPERCVYNLKKCSKVDCNTFSPTNLFSDCCVIDDWEKFMDKITMKRRKEENITEGGEVGSGGQSGELEIEYDLRRASGEEFHRRTELERGLYE
jgi:hypothetical protein